MRRHASGREHIVITDCWATHGRNYPNEFPCAIDLPFPVSDLWVRDLDLADTLIPGELEAKLRDLPGQPAESNLVLP